MSPLIIENTINSDNEDEFDFPEIIQNRFNHLCRQCFIVGIPALYVLVSLLYPHTK